jgi:hypothetical protein
MELGRRVNRELAFVKYYNVRHVTASLQRADYRKCDGSANAARREGPQHCLSFELTTEPQTRITASRDYLGNIVPTSIFCVASRVDDHGQALVSSLIRHRSQRLIHRVGMQLMRCPTMQMRLIC